MRGRIVIVILRDGYRVEEVLKDTNVSMYYWVKIIGNDSEGLETMQDTPARTYKLF